MAPTDKQLHFLDRLVAERDLPAEVRDRIAEARTDGDRRQVSGWIDRLLNEYPRAAQAPGARRQVRVSEPGVYRRNGEVFIVKPPRERTKRDEGRLYAKRMVERPGIERMAEDGTPIYGVDFIYAPGAIFELGPEDRMPFEDAKALTARYARCIVCGAHLRDRKSVERGIGPVCRGYFPDAGVSREAVREAVEAQAASEGNPYGGMEAEALLAQDDETIERSSAGARC